MLKGLDGRIKVAASIKPLPVEKRTIPEIVLGGNYYVSFGSNDAYPCTVSQIINEFSKQEVKIEIPAKPLSKKGCRDANGVIRHSWTESHTLYVDEIGFTPQDAVRNTVR